MQPLLPSYDAGQLVKLWMAVDRFFVVGQDRNLSDSIFAFTDATFNLNALFLIGYVLRKLGKMIADWHFDTLSVNFLLYFCCTINMYDEIRFQFGGSLLMCD